MAYLGSTRKYLLHVNADEATHKKAHELRHPMTEAERVLWDKIRNRKLNGMKFRRQHPIHYYIADFYCHEKRLVVEVDGGIHRQTDVKEHDENRDAELERLGITVIRFTNDEVFANLQGVLDQIVDFVRKGAKQSPHLPPGQSHLIPPAPFSSGRRGRRR